MSKTRLSSTGCLEWTGATYKTGYACIRVDKKSARAHRVIWEEHNKEKIPDGMLIRHKCDNRICVNPDHLELGTQADNMHDCINRGRFKRGEDSKKSSLSNRDVIDICERLDNKETCTSIAENYGVHRVAINDIKLGKNWAWLTGR